MIFIFSKNIKIRHLKSTSFLQKSTKFQGTSLVSSWVNVLNNFLINLGRNDDFIKVFIWLDSYKIHKKKLIFWQIIIFKNLNYNHFSKGLNKSM